MRLTLRTLLAYLDDTLEANEARQIGEKLSENGTAQELVEKIRRVRRSRSIATPINSEPDTVSDPNIVAQYLNDKLSPDQVTNVEESCLKSDVHLAEISACHQILTHVLSEQIRVPPTARQRMYKLVKGRESLPKKKVSNVIPVGGIPETERPAEDDDHDVGYLLGLPAYSRSDALGKRLTKLSVVALLLIGSLVALWIALPPREATQPGQPVRYASLTATVVETKEQGSAGTEIKELDPVTPTPANDDDTEPVPPVVVNNPPKPIRNPTLDDLLKPPMPASEERRIVGGFTNLDKGVLVHRSDDQATWERAQGEAAELVTTERYILLPGYKEVTLSYGSGLDVELWANLPELDPNVPVIATALTPLFPESGINAELRVTVGRFYLRSVVETPLKVRIRFDGANDETWDITLANAETELALEVSRVLPAGQPDAPSVIYAAFTVLNGSAEVRVPGKDVIPLQRSGQIYWDSQNRKHEVSAKSKPDDWANVQGYFAKKQFYPNAQQAEAAILTLNNFKESMTTPQRLQATLNEAELSQPTREVLPQVAARIAITMQSVLADLTSLSTLLADNEVALHRVTAIDSIQYGLSSGLIAVQALRTNLQSTLQLDDSTTTAIIQLLFGPSEVEQTTQRDQMLDRLYRQMTSDELPIRELAFRELMRFIDPQDPNVKKLAYFDPAGPLDQRRDALESWGKMVEQLKAKPEPESKK